MAQTTTTPTPIFSAWGNNFATQWTNPNWADGISAAMGGVSGVFGLAAELSGEAAQTADLLIGGQGSAVGVAISGSQEGLISFFENMAGSAAGTLAGWGVSGGVEALLVAAALPEAAAVGVAVLGIGAAVLAAYTVGKAVTSGIDTFNQWQQDAITSNSPITNTLANGTMVVNYTNGNYSIGTNGTVYSYDSQGNVTDVSLAGGQTILVNNQTGVLTASDSSGVSISTKVTSDANGGLQFADPTTGDAQGTIDQTTDGGMLLGTLGGQVTIPSAQSGLLPSLFQLSSDGTTSTTTVSADGLTANTVTVGAEGAPSVTSITVENPSTNSYQTTTASSNGVVHQTDTFVVNSDGSTNDDLKGQNSSGSTEYEQDTTTQANGQVSATISGSGDVAYINNAVVSLAAGAAATINGNGSITIGVDGYATLTGNGNVVTEGAGATAVIGSQSINDIITMATSGTVVVDDGASCRIVGAANGTVTLDNGSSADINGAVITDTASTTPSSTTVKFNGSGNVSQTEAISTDANGVKTDDLKMMNPDGTLGEETNTITNADGSTLEDVTYILSSAYIISETIATSADGLSKLITENVNGTAVLTESITTDSNGVYTDDKKILNSDGSLQSEVVATKITNADGGSVLDTKNLGANGTLQSESITATSINADGGSVADVKYLDATGTLQSEDISITNADGSISSEDKRYSGGSLYADEVDTLNIDGSQVVHNIFLDSNGNLEIDSLSISNADHSTSSDYKNYNPDGSLSFELIGSSNADGSKIVSEHIEYYKGAVTSDDTSTTTIVNGVQYKDNTSLNPSGDSTITIYLDGTTITRTNIVNQQGSVIGHNVFTVTQTGNVKIEEQQSFDLNGVLNNHAIFTTTTNADGSSLEDDKVFDFISGKWDENIYARNANGGLASRESLTYNSATLSWQDITDYYNADGSLGTVIDTITSADGGTSRSTSDAHGNTTSDSYAANGVLSSVAWSSGNSYVITTGGSLDNTSNNTNDGSGSAVTYNADGSFTMVIRDGENNTTTKHYATTGVLIADTYGKTDGTSGSDTFNADGSSSGTKINVDGTSNSYINDGKGNVTTTNFNASGNKIGDTWTKADGSSGNDTFNANGSSSGTAAYVGGTSSIYSNDGNGNVTSDSYTTNGLLSAVAWNSGDQYVTTTTWSHVDGSSGSASTNTNDGSSNTTATNADGSSSIVMSDGKGNTTTKDYTASGVLADDTWVKVNGTSGSDTFNVDGSIASSALAVDDGNRQVTLGDINATVTLGSGTDNVLLGNGNDTLDLGSGSDTVVVGASAGKLSDTGQSTVVASPLGTSELLFSNANSDQLWFQRSGNNLDIGVIGTSFQLDVSNWYGDVSNRVQSIVAADGKTLAGGQVDALVIAMASFNPPVSGASALPDAYQSQLQPTIVANWH